MKTVFLLIGVRGAGKTTLLKNLKNDNDSSIYVMSSSTTRTPRDNDAFIIHENIDAWNNDDFVYHISIGNNKYGLRKSEIDKIQNSQIGITLYSPSSFSQIAEDQKKNPNIQFVTIGIDTIDTIEEQRNRVNNDDSRLDTPDNFAEYLEITRNQCSITLKGKESALVDQVKTIANLFIHGGVVAGKDLEVLLKNNQLVNSAIIDNKKYECASYNFHVGDQYFFVEKNEDGLQDKRFELTETKGVTINPYTYIIIQTKEIMNLPTFIVGNFDLTVKLFHHGLILSASTQIDPGYRGALTCLLYNTSDQPINLRQNDTFLTVQYTTTTCNTKGYCGTRKDKNKLNEQILADSQGHSTSDLNKAVNFYKKAKITLWASVIIPVVVALLSFAGNLVGSKHEVEKYKNGLDDYKAEVISEEFKQEFYQTFKQDVYQELKTEISAEVKQAVTIEIHQQ